MRSKRVLLAALISFYPRLGDSTAHPIAAEMKEARHAQEDTAIRLQHAEELLGHDFSSRVPKDFSAPYNVSPAVHVLVRRAMKGPHRGQSNRIANAIVAEGRKRRLDPVFLCAVIERESRFIPTKVGSHGEIGLMQIRPATGEWIARKYLLPWHGAETLRDPVSNIRIGAAYFAFLRQSFKARGQLYLSAYNLGPKKTRDKVGQQIWPKEYFSQVMRNFLHYHRQVSRFSAKYAALDR